MKALEDVRLLSVEERISLALMFYKIPGLEELCGHSVEECLEQGKYGPQVEELLNEHKVPTLSTELKFEEKEALATGIKPDPSKPLYHLNYKGVLSEEDGKRLEDFLNIGEFTQLGQKTNRPLSTYKLTVPEEFAGELLSIHERWLTNRICVLVESTKGLFWLTPDTAHRGTNTQHYAVVPSVQVDRLSLPNHQYEKTGPSWREVLEDLITKRPELGFVQQMLYHYLQPAHIQLLHSELLENQALLMTHDKVTYRVVGVTLQGTLMLTTKIKQGLVYDATIPFKEVAHEATWTLWSPE